MNSNIKQILDTLRNSYMNKYDWTTLNMLVSNNKRVYSIKKNGKQYVIKIILPHVDSIRWMALEEFHDKYYDLNIYYQRIIDNYRLASIINIGAKYHYHIIIGSALVIITEYLPVEYTIDYTRDNKKIISDWIKTIHELGIFHGDLHPGNIRLTSDYELKLIDLETTFYKDELDDPFIIAIANTMFGMEIEEFIKDEQNENPFIFSQ